MSNMKHLTQEQIEKINELCPYELDGFTEGVFVQPAGVPITVKEPVIYCTYESGGISGRGYNSDSV